MNKWENTFGGKVNDFFNITYGDDKFVVASNYGQMFYSETGQIGLYWVESEKGKMWYHGSLRYQNNSYNLVSKGGYLISKKGFSWEYYEIKEGLYLNDLLYSNGRYITVGLKGMIYTSENSPNWKSYDKKLTDESLNRITYGNGRYIVVGDYGSILYSEDAQSWEKINHIIEEDLNNVIFGNGLFIAIGDNGNILISKSGKIWEIIETEYSYDLYGITYLN